MLSESARNWILQVAIDYVDTGKMPDDPFESKEEEECFYRTAEEIKKDREAGLNTTYDVGYDY